MTKLKDIEVGQSWMGYYRECFYKLNEYSWLCLSPQRVHICDHNPEVLIDYVSTLPYLAKGLL